MRIIGYYCGASPERGRAALIEFADKYGLSPIDILEDAEDSFGSFRQVQNLIKRRACDTVLVPSYCALGRDKYTCMENELFLGRNGARLVCIDGSARDFRGDIVVSAKRCVSFLPVFDIEYGLSMPLPDNPSQFKRTPPLGFKVKGGSLAEDPEASDAVRRIFESFIAGDTISDICAKANKALSSSSRRLTNMTVRSVLSNRRYLGVQSGKGYHLPPLIRYDAWLEAQERLYSERGAAEEAEPLISEIVSKKPIRFVDSFSSVKTEGCFEINVHAYNSALCCIVSSMTGENAAEAFIESFAAPELAEAKAAYSEALKERFNLMRSYWRDLDLLSEGVRNERLVERLESRTDFKVMLGLRLRRIGTYAELLSDCAAPIKRLFSRATRISSLSPEERELILRAFIEKVRIIKGEAAAFVKDLETGKLKKIPIPGVIR